jgi:tetratricopeptide (TPR) repeat protein
MFSRLRGKEEFQEKVIRYLNQAVAENPKDARTHAFLGRRYGFLEKWEDSDHHFNEALKLNPNDTTTLKWYDMMQRAWRGWQRRQSEGEKRTIE